MQLIQYKPIEEVDFELEIPTDLFQKIIQEGDNKAYKLLNSDDEIIFVYNKILKWIFKESPFDTTRLKLAYETGYEDGFSDIQKNYVDKYVIGSDQIQINLKEIYRRFKLFRDTNYHKLNPALIIAYGESAGATRRIEELALTYPYDFNWINEYSKGVKLIDENTTRIYWSEYCDLIKDIETPEMFEKFEKRFYLNDEEHPPLIKLGKGGTDKYTPSRKWLSNILIDIRCKIDTSNFNYGHYTKKAFGIDIDKKSKKNNCDRN